MYSGDMFNRARFDPEFTTAMQAVLRGERHSAALRPNASFRRAMALGEFQHSYGRRYPGAPLPPLTTRPLSMRFRRSSERFFRRAVNSTLEPEGLAYDFPLRARGLAELSCRDAERYFGAAILSLARPDLRRIPLRIIADGAEPLLIQKLKGEKSALTLQDLSVNGVTYGAGSLMGVQIARDKCADGSYAPAFTNKRLEVIDAAELEGLRFVRPTLFAVSEPELRDAYVSAYFRRELYAKSDVDVFDTTDIRAILQPLPTVATLAAEAIQKYGGDR